MVWVLAGSATAGVAAQALVLVVPLWRSGFRFRPRWGFRDKPTLPREPEPRRRRAGPGSGRAVTAAQLLAAPIPGVDQGASDKKTYTAFTMHGQIGIQF